MQRFPTRTSLWNGPLILTEEEILEIIMATIGTIDDHLNFKVCPARAKGQTIPVQEAAKIIAHLYDLHVSHMK